MSYAGALLATRALTDVPSIRRSVTYPSFCTTWTLVISVSWLTKNALPRPEVDSTSTTAGMTRSTMSSIEPAAGTAGRVSFGESDERGPDSGLADADAFHARACGDADASPAARSTEVAPGATSMVAGAEAAGVRKVSHAAAAPIPTTARRAMATNPRDDEGAGGAAGVPAGGRVAPQRHVVTV